MKLPHKLYGHMGGKNSFFVLGGFLGALKIYDSLSCEGGGGIERKGEGGKGGGEGGMGEGGKGEGGGECFRNQRIF